MNKEVMNTDAPIAFTNHFAWEAITDGAWAGHPCFIIGGGPSLSNFNWNLLKGKLTIGINRVYEKMNPTIIYGQDPKFLRWILMGKYSDEARTKFLDSDALKIWLNIRGAHLPGNIYILKCWKNYLEGRSAFPFSMKKGIGHGNNSGYGALNLAACLGANPIYLLGYDMAVNGSQTHWHNGHPEKAPDHVPQSFIDRFVPAAEALAKKSIKVINLNPDSKLNIFPKMHLSTVLMQSQAPSKQHPEITREEAKYGPTFKPLSEDKNANLYIAGPYGFGDTFYCRSLVKSLAQRYLNIYVRTTLPEAFWDIENVKFVHPTTPLRAQKKHLEQIDESQEYKWETPPQGIEHKSWGSFISAWRHTEGDAVQNNPRGEESTTKYFVNDNGLQNFDFSFAVKKEWIEAAREILKDLDLKGKKLCIIRPPTVRKEWTNYSRTPKKEYFQLLIDKYKNDYFFITLSNNKKDKEWFDGGKLNGIDKRYDHGELPITTLFGLVKIANMIITPPDFFSILAIATKTKCFCIFGGCAKPDAIFDENMGLDNFRWVTPEPFCNCMRMNHKCHKKIPEKRIVTKFEALRKMDKTIKEVTVALPPGVGDMHWVLEILESFKEKNRIDRLAIAIVDRGPKLQYSSEFLRLIPFVDSVRLMKKISFKFSIIGGTGNPFIKDGKCLDYQKKTVKIDYLMEFNSRLEHGMRIEDILPKYEVNFNYPIVYPWRAKNFVKFIKKAAGNKLYLFYASSHLGNNNWTRGKWDPKEWIALAEKIHAETKKRPILIGAEWDRQYADEIKNQDTGDTIIDLVGKTTLAEMLGLLREANCVVSFLSGIVILATRFKTPCASFWPTLKQAPHWHDPKKFQKSWIPPGADNDGYMPFFYGEKNTTPTGIFEAIRKYL